MLATQDYLVKYGVFIELEINVRVRFNLVSDTELREVMRLYTHPVAHGQCDVFLAKHCPKVEVVFTRSNVDSGLRWANGSPAERTAAIVPSDYNPVRLPPFQHTESRTTSTTRPASSSSRRRPQRRLLAGQDRTADRARRRSPGAALRNPDGLQKVRHQPVPNRVTPRTHAPLGLRILHGHYQQRAQPRGDRRAPLR